MGIMIPNVILIPLYNLDLCCHATTCTLELRYLGNHVFIHIILYTVYMYSAVLDSLHEVVLF